MSVGVSSLRSMSVGHWKLLNYLKEYVSKSSSNEKGVLFILSKEWASVLQKLPMIYGSVDSQIRKNSDSETAIVNKQIKSEDCSQTDSKEPASKDDKGYGLPQVLTGFKQKKSSVHNVEVSEEPMPKWKSSKEAVSKVKKKVDSYVTIVYWYQITLVTDQVPMLIPTVYKVLIPIQSITAIEIMQPLVTSKWF
jgi:hypothetical protein